ncbi:hypothetical protein [Streptomyces sp. NBC_00102]|uniref:hypothetical protein n=1 Tax=Streptomyces sp. NBC_00102 TaxID=2975652 RepID=UPI00225784A2|nr:hypothetical protein [Streptomyces sp. NBC_00102]MCX5399509.1 hypothetical protein [Streptomyces sp. NBC_00102]
MSTPRPGRAEDGAKDARNTEGADDADGALRDRCPATALLPPPPQPVRAKAVTPVGPGRPLRCELAEGHRDEHAELLWDDDRLGGGLWVRWTDTHMYRVMLFWCTHSVERSGEPDDACGLFDDHPSAHSWQIIDTTEDGGAPGEETPAD